MEVSRRSFRLSPLGSRFLSLAHTGQARFGGDFKQTKDFRKDAAKILDEERNGIFRVLDIGKSSAAPVRKDDFRRHSFKKSGPPRHTQMKPEQEWGNVWPAARTFHPAVVPLPVRQGATQIKNQVVPAKYANTELMKIPNFLHLTPPVIKKHCAAIKKFCTAWPAGLNTEEQIDQHFPLQVISSDYLNSSSSLRDRRSRIVVLRFKLTSLQLDQHARDKLIRLIGDRYNTEEDLVTLTTDRCPYRAQNMEYTKYLMTALYYESWKTEDWEIKEHMDKEVYEIPDQEKDEYRRTLQNILNNGEDEASLREYKEATRKLLDLPPEDVTAQIVSN